MPASLWAQTTHTVTNTNDSGIGSLREAVQSAISGDTIEFDAPLDGQTIALAGPELSIATDLTITAASFINGLTISGEGNSRVFAITSLTTATLDSLTITDGSATGATTANRSGGGILNEGTLNLDNVALTNNAATDNGGGIANLVGSRLTITSSTISGNTAGLDGGDRFRILSIGPAPGFDAQLNPLVEVTVSTFPGRSYEFETDQTLQDFQTLPGSAFTADDYQESFQLQLAPDGDFLRGRRPPSP